MQNIAICEDESVWKEQLVHILNSIKTEGELNINVFDSGEELLKNLSYGSYDLIFMDIYMKGLNGIDTVSQIRTIDPDVPIAFTTTSQDYALDAYRLNVIKYLEKPVKSGDIIECLELAYLKKKKRKHISLMISGEEHRFSEDQISFLEQHNHTVHINFCDKTSLKFSGKLDLLENYFSLPTFYRCHKSYIVNLSQVELLDKKLMVFIMKNGDYVYIRRGTLKEASTMYDNFIFNRLKQE